MEGILKNRTKTTVKIKSATIFTRKATHLLIVPEKRRKRATTTKIPSPVNKPKPVFKLFQIYEEV